MLPRPVRVRLALSRIILDESTQCREKTDAGIVADYAEGYRAKEPFPAPDVFGPLDAAGILPDDASVWIGDGHKRVRAALAAGLAELDFDVHAGGEEEAFCFALTANRKHGERFTAADKRSGVRKALLRWAGMSHREIAARAGVGRMLVGEVHKEMVKDGTAPPAPSEGEEEKRTGKDGKKRRTPQRKPKAAGGTPTATIVEPAPPASSPPAPKPAPGPWAEGALFGGRPDDGGPPKSDPGAVTIEMNAPAEQPGVVEAERDTFRLERDAALARVGELEVRIHALNNKLTVHSLREQLAAGANGDPKAQALRLARLVEGFVSACRELKGEDGSVPEPLRDVYEAAREEMGRLCEPENEEAQEALHEQMRGYDGRAEDGQGEDGDAADELTVERDPDAGPAAGEESQERRRPGKKAGSGAKVTRVGRP